MHSPIVFIDVETTGFSARDGRVIELGMVRVEDGKVVATYSQLLDPGMDISWHITNVTGITNEQLYGKPQFRIVLDQVEDFMGGALFAAHNVDFDYGFIKEEFARSGARLAMDRFCTAQLSRRLYPGVSGHSLDKLIERHGYTVNNRHRALDDAMVIAQFFIDHVDSRQTELLTCINAIMKRTRPSVKHIYTEPMF